MHSGDDGLGAILDSGDGVLEVFDVLSQDTNEAILSLVAKVVSLVLTFLRRRAVRAGSLDCMLVKLDWLGTKEDKPGLASGNKGR